VDLLIILLRIVHIAAGVFWVGAAFTFFLFVLPSVKVLGPNAGPFMNQLNIRRHFPEIVILAGAAAVLAGGILYWMRSGGLNPAVITSGPMLAFAAGGITGTVALIIAAFVVRPRARGMNALGGQIAAAGRPPTEEEAAQLGTLEHAIKRYGAINLVLLTITVIAMASARYL
jgi:uncharacterized membrane protein